MGQVELKGLERKTVEERFDSLFDDGWRFIPERKKASDKKIKGEIQYRIKSPLGNDYSLCNFNDKELSVGDISSYDGMNTEFDAEVEACNENNYIRKEEGEIVSEVIESLKDMPFPLRRHCYKKYEKPE